MSALYNWAAVNSKTTPPSPPPPRHCRDFSTSHVQLVTIRRCSTQSGTGSAKFISSPIISSHRLLLSSNLQPNYLLTTTTLQFSMANSTCSEGNVKCADPDYAEIVVIRHGETAWNADARIQGHLDVELNEVGRQQAVTVAARLSKEPKISAVYSSDLKRAHETAEIIASSCGGLEVIKDPDLRERHLGDLQGLVFHEAAKINPEAHQAFVSHRKDQVIPGGGESINQLHQRCTSSLQRIGKKHRGERVVVVTHGGVIRSLYKRASSHGRSAGKVLNASVNVFHLSDGDEWIIKTWGDVSHLDQTGFLESGFGGDRTSG